MISLGAMQEGAICHTANNATQAITILNAHPEIEVVITDKKMPDMSGNELIRWINHQLPFIKTILISGDITDDKIEGNTGYIEKPPSSYDVIVSTILELLTNEQEPIHNTDKTSLMTSKKLPLAPKKNESQD